ncbi:MAG: hypothetical protein JW969_13070 [Spirochaetales bacterium]|nr:hypothetical protein [Spirochaetales bacterium]
MGTSGEAFYSIGLGGCLGCKRAIEHAGRVIEGIKEIEVNIATHSIHVFYENDKKSALAELEDMVRRIGYEPVRMKN